MHICYISGTAKGIGLKLSGCVELEIELNQNALHSSEDAKMVYMRNLGKSYETKVETHRACAGR